MWICQTMYLLISNFKTIGYILRWKMCLYRIIMVLYRYNGSLLQKCFDTMYAVFTCQLHSYHIQNYLYKCPCCTHFYDFEMRISLVMTCYNDDINIVDRQNAESKMRSFCYYFSCPKLVLFNVYQCCNKVIKNRCTF